MLSVAVVVVVEEEEEEEEEEEDEAEKRRKRTCDTYKSLSMVPVGKSLFASGSKSLWIAVGRYPRDPHEPTSDLTAYFCLCVRHVIDKHTNSRSRGALTR